MILCTTVTNAFQQVECVEKMRYIYFVFIFYRVIIKFTLIFLGIVIFEVNMTETASQYKSSLRGI